MLHTKIVATIGPASDSPDSIRELIQSGVRVFRFNMKHADTQWHRDRIPVVREIAKELLIHVGVLIDLQGPEIRIETPSGQPVQVGKNEHVLFALEMSNFENQERLVGVPHPEFFSALDVGDKFTIDDGFLEFAVIAHDDESLMVEALEDSEIRHRKGLNIVGRDIDLPSLADIDIPKLDLAKEAEAEFIALSFTRSKQDVEELREELSRRELNSSIVAKIESQAALDNIDDIIETADVIMVARGDLGIETPIEQLAYWQKTIITKARMAHKPVITATQMLESMIKNPLPSRAEATDVANAILDGTDAIMLSGETAGGRYPIKTVQVMARIAEFNEAAFPPPAIELQPFTSTEVITTAVQTMIRSCQDDPIQSIVAYTETGYTARVMSSLRLNLPIYAMTESEVVARSLSMTFGVHPTVIEFQSGIMSSTENELKKLEELGHIRPGDRLLLIHGKFWRTPGFTNTLSLITYGA